ncbi:MAG TPA: dihydroorotate dehydrogenase electron transfer subunit [Methanomassiliicoccales archaeon]|nr:dihydroorotate dehydrogenase electron transfer subunit [Methanomassiliicoccales archaeon]
MNRQAMTRVKSVVCEGEGMTTLRFALDRPISPGQFLMIWLPGLDEVPMSASYVYGDKGITVKEVGEATKALSCLKPGDHMGVRGPYGHGFELASRRTLLVGGGSGIASLLPVADFIGDPEAVDVLIGARTSTELVFVERAKKLSKEVHVSTDDGSKGREGTVVEMAREHLIKKSYDLVVGCGPERMLAALLKACDDAGVPCQLSLERYMKCGTGLCGSCAIDGLRVCADGPVFSGDVLRGLPEFGSCKRDECGRSIKL